MPVRRYHDLEEAEQDLWLDSSDPTLGARIHDVWRFTERFTAPRPKGVTRIEIVTAPEPDSDPDARTRAVTPADRAPGTNRGSSS